MNDRAEVEKYEKTDHRFRDQTTTALVGNNYAGKLK